MTKQSESPKERINVTYKPATGDQNEEIEIPYKITVLGEFNPNEEKKPVEDKKVININKGAVNSIVTIDIGGGNIITATISCAAVEELGLEVGSDAYAVIKATNVMMGIDE